MKLSDIVTEQQLDELDVAGGIARGLGAVSKGVGAIGGAAAGAIDAAKSGFAAGRAAVGGYKAPAAQDSGVQGTLNTKELAGVLPGIDPNALAKAVAVVKAGGEPSMGQQKELANAFMAMLKADPAATTKAASLLKRVSAEPAQAAAPAATPAAGAAPQTPDQIRAAKQATAGAAAQAQMKANPAAPKPAAPQTPDQIRAAKQATAGQAARDQMAGNTASPAAGNKPAGSFNNQLAGGNQTITTKPTGNYDGKTGAPLSDKAKADAEFDASPAGKAMQAKVDAMGTTPADPGAAAFGNMAKTLTQEPKAAPTASTAAPAADTAQTTTGGKLTPAQQAAMKAKLQGQRSAGKTAGTTSSGFNQYTKDASSQRIVGANPDGSPKIQTIKAGKINTGNNLSEMLAANIAKQKKKIAEEQTAIYENSSIFTK